jgi:uncharacterized protein YdeI (YjbR/CyaY-like superfamily)
MNRIAITIAFNMSRPICRDVLEESTFNDASKVLAKDNPKKVLVQLGQVHAARVMKFNSVKDITAKEATIKAYLREPIAVEKAGLRVEPKKTSDYPVPDELTERFRRDPRFKRAFEALTPGRQRSYLYHFAAAKQSATRVGESKRRCLRSSRAEGSWRDAKSSFGSSSL